MSIDTWDLEQLADHVWLHISGEVLVFDTDLNPYSVFCYYEDRKRPKGIDTVSSINAETFNKMIVEKELVSLGTMKDMKQLMGEIFYEITQS